MILMTKPHFRQFPWLQQRGFRRTLLKKISHSHNLQVNVVVFFSFLHFGSVIFPRRVVLAHKQLAIKLSNLKLNGSLLIILSLEFEVLSS